ncbi:MAG: DMT family transporter [Oscillospiraceae bacterium]
MKSTNKHYILIASAACLWGCIGVFFKMLTAEGLSSMQAVAVRVIVAAVIYAGYLLFTDKSAFKVRLRHLPYFVGTGILSLVMFNWCYFTTIKASSMAVAAVLLYTSPVFVCLMSAILFREKLTGKKIFALALAFGGCILVTGVLAGGAGQLPMRAILIGIGSGFGYALYSIFGKYALRNYPSSTVTLYTFVFAAIGVLPFAKLGEAADLFLTKNVIIGGVCIGVLCCILPYILYTEGLSGVETGKASIIATLEPVVAAGIGVMFYNEGVTFMKTAGMILVISAVFILNMKEKTLLPAKR